MKLKKCKNCSEYTIKYKCPKCESETSSAHYKFVKIRDAPKITDPRKIRKN